MAIWATPVLLLALTLPASASSTTTTDGIELGGTPVEPSTDPAEPTELAAGLWADTLGVPETPEATHQFRYRRTIADSTVHIGAVGVPPAEAGDRLEIAVTEPGGEDCGSDDASPPYPTTHAVFGAAVAIGPDEPGERDSPCLEADELSFSVGRGSSAATGELPIAVKIVEEAPVDNADSLPAAPDSPAYRAPDVAGPGEEVTGATSFADAPLLLSGTTYADAVAEGEERLYRVRLGWGQALSLQARSPAQDEAADEATAFVSPGVALTMIDPMRESFSDVLDGADASGTYGDEPSELSAGTPPVGYLNRYDGLAATLPGDYWISVAVQPPVDRAAVDVPFELVVEVWGEETGEPSYPQTVQGPGGVAGPAEYDAATPFVVGDGEFSADPSGNPASGADDDAAGFWGSRQVGGLGLAVLSAGCCVAGALRLRRG